MPNLMNSGLLGGLEVDRSTESWAGHDSPHKKDGRYEQNLFWGRAFDVTCKKARMW